MTSSVRTCLAVIAAPLAVEGRRLVRADGITHPTGETVFPLVGAAEGFVVPERSALQLRVVISGRLKEGLGILFRMGLPSFILSSFGSVSSRVHTRGVK